MGMLLHRHYIDALKNNSNEGVTKEVAPKVASDKSVAPVVAKKMPSKVAENSPNYTKTIINRTSTEELKKIAVSVGINDANSYTGAELKKLIILKLGL